MPQRRVTVPEMVSTKVRFAAVCGVAGLGIAAGAAVGHRGSDAARIVTVTATHVESTGQNSLADWLDEMRQRLALRSDQSAAWQKYADVITGLDRSRRALELQLASGATQDVGAERARHALVLATALDELAAHLSPRQQADARQLTQFLASTVICRELAVR